MTSTRTRPADRRTRRGPHRPRADGFTLLELIVAAGILATIAVFSWRGLDTLIREREAIAASQEIIDRLQRVFARVEKDALLATDAQLNEVGTLRLVSGASGTDGASAAVEYRLVDGTLTRSVSDSNAASLALLDGVAALTMEAWLPAPRGGGWVRIKGAASQAPRPRDAAGRTKANATGNATDAARNATAPGTSLPANSGNAANAVDAAASGATGANAARGTQAPAGPTVAAATGIRLSIARADGSKLTRSFLVGGG